MTQPTNERRTLPEAVPAWPAGGPTSSAWREQAIARVYALRTIARWARHRTEIEDDEQADELLADIYEHLQTASEAAGRKKSPWTRLLVGVRGSDVERTMAHINAAEIAILRLAPGEYVRGQMPALQVLARDHLPPGDPRHAVLRKLGAGTGNLTLIERDSLVAIVRSANDEARGEVTRVRSFRNLLIAATLILTVAAIGVGVFGALAPDRLALCFNPGEKVVCPTGEARVPPAEGTLVEPIFDRTASPWDVFVVELVGLLAAAVAAAFAVSKIRGTSTPYSLPVAQAALKLPLGALTAVLGLLLMRGEFVPGLSALDTPAQILAWAVVFGYAQQLFTRLVDQRVQSVLEDVGGAAQRASTTAPPPTT
jgi:hypothetical protein